MGSSKFDGLLIQLGTGKWNIFYFAIVCWYTFFLPGQILSVIFAAPSVSFTCVIPEGEADIAPPQNSLESCKYMVNSSRSGGWEEKPCSEWNFDNTSDVTLTTEFQLVCGRSYFRSAYHGIFMLGNLFGPAIGGVISDRYGRRRVVISGGLLFSGLSLGLAFVHHFPLILTIRFLMGFCHLPTAYILALEITEPKLRSYVGILLALPWALGTMAYPGIAYIIRDWYWLQVTMALPLVFLLPAAWLLDESPRWLIVRGRHEEALGIIQKAARWNKVKLPPQAELRGLMKDIQLESKLAAGGGSANSLTEVERLHVDQTHEERDSKVSCLNKCGLCSTRYIRIVTFVMTFTFFVSSLVFYGLSLSAKNFSANVYIYIFLGGLAEVPAYSLTSIIVARFGRRLSLAVCFFFCGVSLIVLIITPTDISWMVILLAMVGKLGISSAGQMVYLYLSELYPTEYRLQGLGTAILAQRIGSILAPLSVQILGPLAWWAPSVLMGILALLAGMATLFLPETLGAILPDTLPDLEELFSKNKKRAAMVH
ncbi:hypothetical protein SK128_012595 [Halocaridina rubra]|uniref:Major facilitator superfamily (MFS) profile domain-containing protein n=1 Tax=Halocaridina rubra TaxID=373956 RepID=A0AAN9A6Z8_HALRR